MKKISIIIALIIITLNAKAQFSVNASLGYGSYKMSDMKELMNSVITTNGLPPNAKLVDNFPGNIMYNLDGGYQFGKNEAGLRLSFMTTGAKVAVSDYSGLYEEKLITNGYRIGAFYRYHFYSKNINQHSTISFFGELSPALTIAQMKTMGKLVIYNSDNTTNTENAEELKKTQTGFSIQPLAGMRFKFHDHLLLTIGAGYDFEFGANLGNGYRMDFSGFRANAGVGYMF